MTVREMIEQLRACQFPDAEVVIWDGSWLQQVRIEEGGSLQPGYNVPEYAFKEKLREAVVLHMKRWEHGGAG